MTRHHSSNRATSPFTPYGASPIPAETRRARNTGLAEGQEGNVERASSAPAVQWSNISRDNALRSTPVRIDRDCLEPMRLQIASASTIPAGQRAPSCSAPGSLFGQRNRHLRHFQILSKTTSSQSGSPSVSRSHRPDPPVLGGWTKHRPVIPCKKQTDSRSRADIEPLWDAAATERSGLTSRRGTSSGVIDRTLVNDHLW